MIDLCKQAGLPDPQFRQDGAQFIQTLRRPKSENLEHVNQQIGTKSALSRNQVKILDNCREDRSLLDLMKIVNRSDRTKFRYQVLNPLINNKFIEMTISDKPTSRLQKYRLTEKGQNWLKKNGQDKQ